MKISIKRFTPKYIDGKLNKQQAMFDCVKDFKVHKVDSLEELGVMVNNNVVYSPVEFENSHRNKDNAIIKDIDLLVFDIDDGQTIDEVLNGKLGSKYEIMTLTTASHSEKLHKFRVFIPLAKPISFDNADEYREFYKFIDEYYGFKSDSKVMEAGRGYIGIKGREAIISAPSEWLDLTSKLAEIKRLINKRLEREKLKNKIKAEQLLEYRKKHNIKVPTIDKLTSEKKWLEAVSQLGSGNNYEPVFKLLGYCKFRGLSEDEAVAAVLTLNIGGEYSNPKDLAKKFRRVK